MTRFLYSRYWPAAQSLLPIAALVLYAAGIMATAQLLPAMNDRHVLYALACVIVQAVALLLLAGGLLASKFVLVHWNERRRRRIERISDLFAQYSFGAERNPELLAAARAHPTEFLGVWEASLNQLKGSPRLQMEGLLTETGLDHRLLAQLTHHDPGQVLSAIALLRKLEQPPMDAIEKTLDHPAEAVRMAARIAIASRGSSQAQERVLDQLPNLPSWQRVVLFQQIPADSSALQDYLERAFQTGDEVVVLAALEWVLSRQRFQPVSHARRLANSVSLEIRIKFFKALPFLATDEDATSLIRLGLDDPDWRVRAMAARTCGVLRISALGPELVQRFAHATHPVEAGHLARTLAALGGDSWRRLQRFTVSDDEMIRAVATEVIEKHFAHAQEQAQ
jgi:hypothetical protein